MCCNLFKGDNLCWIILIALAVLLICNCGCGCGCGEERTPASNCGCAPRCCD